VISGPDELAAVFMPFVSRVSPRGSGQGDPSHGGEEGEFGASAESELHVED